MPNRKLKPQRADGRWSDVETSALIDAWGPLYLHRNRGPLPVEEWRLAASCVNANRAAAGSRFNQTRVQCQKRVRTLKAQYKELSKPPPSGWRRFPRLYAASSDSPPPGFPAKVPSSVKEEEVIGGGSGLVGSWTVPTRPRNGAAGCCPAAVVTKLAEVYERVELARLDIEKEKMEMVKKKTMLEAVKDGGSRKLEETAEN